MKDDFVDRNSWTTHRNETVRDIEINACMSFVRSPPHPPSDEAQRELRTTADAKKTQGVEDEGGDGNARAAGRTR